MENKSSIVQICSGLSYEPEGKKDEWCYIPFSDEINLSDASPVSKEIDIQDILKKYPSVNIDDCYVVMTMKPIATVKIIDKTK